jgi:hypothetical protein
VQTRVAAVLLVAALVAGTTACSGGGLFGKEYEYEEDLTLSIDGSATLVVNASLPVLAVLRGLPVSTDANAAVDRDAVAALFQSPAVESARVGRPWRRKGRRFVQVRIEVPDVRKLGEVAPFAWSTYQFGAEGGKHVYVQRVGPSAFKSGSLQNYGWDGSELVAFRLHLPSKILFHNARDVDTNETTEIARGNILSWEQRLADRLEGRPVDVRVEMESESILHRTLWLFAGAFGAAVLLLVLLIAWTVRKGRDKDEPAVS